MINVGLLKINMTFTIHRFQNFRKKLPLDYKKGDRHSHKNPHAIPLEKKDKLLNVVKGGDWKKIRQIERNSLTPYGTFSREGFRFDKEKLPFYDIPNVQGFELKPYVEYMAPKMSEELRNYQKTINQKKLKEFLTGVPSIQEVKSIEENTKTS